VSEVIITIERIEAVEPHPGADKLEIAKVAGTQTVVPKGQYRADDLVIYFPPDILLPGDVSDELGVTKYLKYAIWEGFNFPCRVAACRLRGAPSYGFVHHINCTRLPRYVYPGLDVTARFNAEKYEPPVRLGAGDQETEPVNFHHYTDIQHYRTYRDLLAAKTPVRITEKLHGTNSRVGLLKVDGEWQFFAGGHETARGPDSVYWYPLQLEGVLEMLTSLCDERNDVILFGELYGPGVQDLDYAVPAGEIGWRLFDCSVNGRYLD